jgi:thioredoxin-related protein
MLLLHLTKDMKTIVIASLCSLLSFLPAAGADGWMTDFEAAKKKAAAENKSLLIDFTGSDWCGWCIKLREEVFDHEAFSKGVGEHFILVELDYPKDKSKMSEATIAQNDKLVEEYAIQGYPTIYLTDAAGRPYGKTGYQPGGPKAYLAHLGEIREKLAARDKAIANVKKAKGKSRGAALEAVLAAVPQESISKFYGKELAELSKVSPKAELVVSLAKAEAQANQEKKFNALFQAGDFEGVVKLVDKIAKEQKLAGLELQEIYVYKVNAYAMAEKFMKAVEVLDQVTAIDPETEYGKGAQKYKLSLLAKQAEMKKPGRAVSTPVKVKGPKENAAEDAKAEGKKEGRPSRKRAAKQEPARGIKGLAGKSVEDLQKGLEKAKAAHKKAVNKVNNTDAMLLQLGKDAVAREQDVKKRIAEVEKAKAAVADAKKKHAVMEKEHNAAHQEEGNLKRMVAVFDAELKRRGEIAELEKQAEELQKKAEALRKKAEKLKE